MEATDGHRSTQIFSQKTPSRKASRQFEIANCQLDGRARLCRAVTLSHEIELRLDGVSPCHLVKESPLPPEFWRRGRANPRFFHQKMGGVKTGANSSIAMAN